MATEKKAKAAGDGDHERAAKKAAARQPPVTRSGHAAGTAGEGTRPKRSETSRRRADAEIKLSLEHYQAIVENQLEFVDRFLPGGILTFVNTSLANYVGLRAEDLVGRSFFDFLLPDDRRELSEKLGTLTSANPTVLVENRIRLPDGTIRWLQWSNQAFFDGSGQVLEYQAVGRDITDQKRAAEALQESESRFRELFETSRDGIVITDLSGRYLECNRAYLDLLGYDTIDQLRLKSCQEVTPREYHAFESGVIASQTLTRGWSDEYEKEYLRRTGERIWVSLRAWLHRDAAGQPTGMWAIVREITSHKKLEDARKFLVECGAKGDDFFPSLAQYLAGSLAMDYVCIDRLEGDLLSARTVAVYFDGRFEDNASYTLQDTPCGEVVGKEVCCFSDGVRQRFPKDTVLQEMRAESYVGVTLWSHTHQPIGLIAVIGRRPLGDAGLAESVLKLAAIRAASELERNLAEAKLIHSKNLMQYVISHAQSAIAVHDRDMNYIYVSDQYLRQYKVKEKDVIGKHHYDVFPDLPQKWRDVHQRVLAGAIEGRDEDPYVREDGSVDWTRWDCRPWYESDGTVGGLIVYTEVITERKRREEALRESERRFKTLAENAPVGIFQTDARGDCVYVNAVWCALTGLTPDEARGKGWARAVHPEDMDEVFKGWHEGDRARRESIREYRYVTPAGAVSWVLGTSVTLTADDGTVTGFIGSVADITERKRAEEALRESKELFALFLRHSPIYSFIKEVTPTQSRVLQASDNFQEMIGICGSDMAGKTMAELFPPDFAAKIAADDWAVVSGRAVLKLEEKLNGRTYTTIKFPLFQGERTLLAGYTIDITDKAQAEKRLQESEQFIRTILDTVDEGFLVIDRDYRILSVNRSYANQVSRTSGELIGRRCHEISHGSLRPCCENGEECAVREVFATGTPHVSIHKHRGPDGDMTHVETKAYPIRDASGGVVSAIETISNITEKHLLEEERLKTQKLESIGTLAGGIAHDFNNLLQGVFGYIAMAKLTFDQREKSLAMLGQAEKALHLSVNLTTQLLTFSKGGKPVKKRISLLPAIENAAKFALSGSRSECRISSDPELWPVDADEGQLGQVIQNIVLNADQAMPLGGSVAISVRNLPASREARPPFLDKKDCVLVSIQDSGVGIPAAYLGKIFDPYFTTKEKGSGLGLATSYSIIRNHGGVIDVMSEPGKGSTFLIYLPALAALPEAPRLEAVGAAVTRTGRILVMDDEELVRNLARDMLKALGHTVDVADNGETALALYRSTLEAGRPFDAVILDLTIRGGMSGEETLKKLLEINPDVRAVVSSGYSDDAARSDYRQQGFKATLNKPYTMAQLKSTLDSLLG